MIPFMKRLNAAAPNVQQEIVYTLHSDSHTLGIAIYSTDTIKDGCDIHINTIIKFSSWIYHPLRLTWSPLAMCLNIMMTSLMTSLSVPLLNDITDDIVLRYDVAHCRRSCQAFDIAVASVLTWRCYRCCLGWASLIRYV